MNPDKKNTLTRPGRNNNKVLTKNEEGNYVLTTPPPKKTENSNLGTGSTVNASPVFTTPANQKTENHELGTGATVVQSSSPEITFTSPERKEIAMMTLIESRWLNDKKKFYPKKSLEELKADMPKNLQYTHTIRNQKIKTPTKLRPLTSALKQKLINKSKEDEIHFIDSLLDNYYYHIDRRKQKRPRSNKPLKGEQTNANSTTNPPQKKPKTIKKKTKNKSTPNSKSKRNPKSVGPIMSPAAIAKLENGW